LAQDTAATNHATIVRCAIEGAFFLDSGDPNANTLDDLIVGAELARNHELQLDLLGHRAVVAKQEPWTSGLERLALEQRTNEVRARPLVDSLDQAGLDWVRRGVDQLVDQIVDVL
jgi:hypothetical protein